MTANDEAGRLEAELSRLSDTLRVLLAAPYDIRKTDLETTFWKIKLLTAAAEYFNIRAFLLVGGHLGENRGSGLLEEVIAAPFQAFGGIEIHGDDFERAAMLVRGITQGHPFGDGNKRTGFLTAAYYLEQIGYPMPDTLDQDAVTAFCMDVSAGNVRDIDAMAERLRAFWRLGEKA